MNVDLVRAHAQAAAAALEAGDIDRLIEELSDELKRNVGEVVSLLPLPVTAAEVASVDQTGKAWLVTFNLTGETDAAEVQTRWKDRDGEPRIVEVSHVARTPVELPAGAGSEAADADADAGTGAPGGATDGTAPLGGGSPS